VWLFKTALSIIESGQRSFEQPHSLREAAKSQK